MLFAQLLYNNADVFSIFFFVKIIIIKKCWTHQHCCAIIMQK